MALHDRTALASAGDDGFVRVVVAAHRAGTGQLRAALAEAQSAFALAPAQPRVVLGLAKALSFAGHDDEAIHYAQLAKTLGWPENDWDLNLVYWQQAVRARNYSAAADMLINLSNAYLKGDDSERERVNNMVRSIYAALDDPSKRTAVLAARTRWYPRNSLAGGVGAAFSCGTAVQGYVLLHALDTAYDLENQCIDEVAPIVSGVSAPMLWMPESRSFRQDPRFQALATRLGWMDYWRQYGPPDDCDLKDGKLTCR